MKAIQRATSLAALAALCLVASCAWRPYTGDLRPSVEEMQGPNMSVADDGTITVGFKGANSLGNHVTGSVEIVLPDRSAAIGEGS